MPGITGNPHHGYNRHVRLAPEDEFGVCSDVPDWRDVPILADGYRLRAASPRYFPATNIGGHRRGIGIAHQQLAAGTLTTLAWVELTEFLLGAALHRDDDGEIASFTLDCYTPADPRRVLGAVAESVKLDVEGTGAAQVRIELGLRARIEQAHPGPLSEDDFDYSSLSPVPFMFCDARIRLDAAHVTDIESFRLDVDNSVAAGPIVATDGSALGTVAYLVPGRRKIRLDLRKVSNDDRFGAAIRSGGTVSFEADFVHPDGHIWQMKLPALAPESSDEAADADEPVSESPLLHALTNEDGDDILWAVDLGPTTTTLESFTTTPSE